MAETEFEFMGNNRYFKYKYTQETPINISTITETWETESIASFYKIASDYLKRSSNMKVIYEGHKVNVDQSHKIYNAPEFFNNVNAIIRSTSSSFFYGREKYFSPSPAIRTARTIIVSGPPKKVLTTTYAFLNMDTDVLILMGSTLVILSILLVVHSIVTNKYKSLPTKKVVKKMAQETLGNVWVNASLLCAEPIPSILPHITCRLLASSWLIGVSFILFFLGCFMRTEFTMESYNYIDTLSDLIKSRIAPIMIKGSGTLYFLKYLAGQDPEVQEWLEAQDEEELIRVTTDYTKLDGYIPITFGENALITEDNNLNWIMGKILTSDPESKKFLVENGGLYYSQHEVGFVYFHFIFNTSWLRSSPQLRENLQLSLKVIFETQVFEYLDLEKRYLIEAVKWKRPLKSTVALDLSSVSVPFYLLFMLLSGTVAAVITEIIFNHFA